MENYDNLVPIDEYLRGHYLPPDVGTVEDAVKAKHKLVRDMLAEGTMTKEEAERYLGAVDAQKK